MMMMIILDPLLIKNVDLRVVSHIILLLCVSFMYLFVCEGRRERAIGQVDHHSVDILKCMHVLAMYDNQRTSNLPVTYIVCYRSIRLEMLTDLFIPNAYSALVYMPIHIH